MAPGSLSNPWLSPWPSCLTLLTDRLPGHLQDSVDDYDYEYLDLDYNNFNLATGAASDLDLEELTNEVDGLESLAKEMQNLVQLNNVEKRREKLTKKTQRRRPDQPKGGKRKKKQAKRPKAQRKMGKVQSSGSSGGSSVTLCQLMNICDTIPMGSRTIEGKSGPPYGDMPFASSLRSELVVDAPGDPVTSNTSMLEKQARMEESEYMEGGAAQHREIDFSQGLPVRGSDRFRGSGPRSTRGEDLSRPAPQTDISLPISFINFDTKPSAPSRSRAAKVDTGFASGNLYENMAKQLEAFLEGRQESRHPKMVPVAAKTVNQSQVLEGGEQLGKNLHLDLEDAKLQAAAKETTRTGEELSEDKVVHKKEDGPEDQAEDDTEVVGEISVGVGRMLEPELVAAAKVEAELKHLVRENRRNRGISLLPTMQIETHHKDGERYSQRVYGSGWTPLVIGSVPGMGDRDQTAFMARMLSLSSPKPTLVPLKSWRPNSPKSRNE